jgi:hypothetical protein
MEISMYSITNITSAGTATDILNATNDITSTSTTSATHIWGGGPILTTPSQIKHRWNHSEGSGGTARSKSYRPIAVMKS